MIKLSHVEIPETAYPKVLELMRAGKIGQSEAIEEFEKAFAEWLGVKYCVAVSSGTMADTIALAVLKHYSPEKKKVVVPAHTFIAQINSVIYNGLEPIFTDGNKGYNIEFFEDVLCFFPAHILGIPHSWSMPGISVIEDSCESMGSAINGLKCGAMGDMGTFSFFPSHTITTGEGGMISTNNEDYAKLASRLRNHGKVNNFDFKFDVIGFNGKMSSIQAAIGLSMIPLLDKIIEKRRERFFDLGGTEGVGEFISPHAFPVICESEEKRDKMLKTLRENDIECRNFFSSIPTQETAYAHLGYKPGDFPEAERMGRQALYVPCHQGLSDSDVLKIRQIIEA